MSDIIELFLAATVRTATPLALAAIGELLVERAGLINIGLEGAILAGAFGSLVGASAGGVFGGYVGAVVGGLAVAMIFAAVVVLLEADQIIAGTALTLLSLGATGTLYRALYGSTGAALAIPTSAPLPILFLSRIPVIGPAFFAQPPITYVAYLLIPLVAWWIGRTHAGLARRSSNTESPSESQRGARFSDRPRVKVCASSCHATEPQLNSPRCRAEGASIINTGPKLTPRAPSPERPTVRTEKSACCR